MKPSTQRKSAQQSTHNNTLDGNSTAGNFPSSPVIRRFPGWTLAPLRLFLGITFVYAGVQKLTDPQFFRPSANGYIGKQIMAFAHGSPLHNFLLNVALPHATLFGQLVAYGEIAIGLGALLGLFFRLAALFGMLLSLTFFLSASFHVYPYFYGADIVFTFSWLTLLLVGPLYTGLPSIDGWIISSLAPDDQQPGVALRSLFVLLGENQAPQYITEAAVSINAPGNTQVGQPNARRNIRGIIQKKKQTRRSFLAGALTGGIGALGIAFIAFILRSLGQAGENSANPPAAAPTSTDQSNANGSSSSSSNGTPGASSPSSSNVIAKMSDVAKNSAVTFTIPSSGDPGVLIHLSNDQFVAYDATCTHAGCQVDYDAGSQNLICPCHGATFDPKHAAAVLDGPTSTPLTSVPLHVDAATGAITLQ